MNLSTLPAVFPVSLLMFFYNCLINKCPFSGTAKLMNKFKFTNGIRNLLILCPVLLFILRFNFLFFSHFINISHELQAFIYHIPVCNMYFCLFSPQSFVDSQHLGV